MQLTERQCWKVMRQLASAKNKEYRAILNEQFKDIDQTIQIQGQTRDAFLRRYGIKSLDEFFDEYRKQTKSEPDTSDWIENLDSQSLLIFLDFRCRVLQQIYDYYDKYNNIDRNVIQNIIDGTRLSPLAKFKINPRNNKPALAYSRKPGRAAGGEKKLKELNMTVDELSEQALAQTMGKLVGGYMDTQKASFSHTIDLATGLVTQNTKVSGERTGYAYKGKVAITPQKPVIEQEKEKDILPPAKRKNDMEFIGFDGGGQPLYIKDGVKVDMLGRQTSAKVMYDTSHKLIVDVDETEKVEQIDEELETSASKMVGLDIEGRPVYERDGHYYSSTDKLLPDDVYFEPVDQSVFNR